jgi:hypothetical protein
MVVSSVSSNLRSLEDKESKTKDIQSLQRHSTSEIEAILSRTIEINEKYMDKVSSSLNEIQKLFYKDSDGLYATAGTKEKKIHLNALIGVINYFNDNKEESKNILESIHKQKDKKGHYPLNISSEDRSQVADLFVSILEFFSGNKDESIRLMKLNGYQKDRNGLFTSVNNQYTVLSYPNLIKGIAEAINGQPKKAQKILNTLEEKVGKNESGILYVSNDNKRIYPDVVITVATLKLFTEGIVKSEGYLLSSSISTFDTLEGVLTEAFHAFTVLNMLSIKRN